MIKYKILILIASIQFIYHLSVVYSCNEAVCASIVSKCLITQSCKCDLKNCTCCKDCFNCLNTLYAECCSCVDLCPKVNHTRHALSRQSHVEDLPEPISTLFESLVAEPDSQDRWITLTFPIDVHPLKPNIKTSDPFFTQTNEQEIIPSKNTVTFNCSVAYMSQCMPWPKCRASCQSMGAASYRWFHDGCCECVGENCINYGISENRCTQCPTPETVKTDVELDFGEDDDEIYGD